MERRTFIAGTGIGVGIGMAGCLDANTGSQGDNETDLETDGGEQVSEPSDGESSEAAPDDPETDTESGDESGDDADEAAPARFEVTATSTNSPIGPGAVLTVDATIENVGDESGTTDVELIVGHDPAVEDSRTLTLESGETAEITLEFTAGDPAGGREEFPVRVDTGAHEATETVVVTADEDGEDEGDDGEAPAEGVTFDSCTRATVSGSFEDGDVAYASTLFYTESGVGDTLIEDGVTVGEDVDAPFTGTIVFEIAAESGLEENGDEIVVRVPDYGEYGTVISGLTTDEDDYAFAGVTHSNPHAEDCLEEIEAEWEAATDN